ncbi:MAG: Ig-like domain-containing protein [bacterium]|nr:Ig-like domain-containing protein [bacterium]
MQNNGETGVDCGGGGCPPCGGCNNDSMQNNGETGVDCGGGGCPDCGDLTGLFEFGCWEYVSKDSEDGPWSTSVSASGGDRVYFKQEVSVLKGSRDVFEKSNDFDQIIDGYTNIWQNSDDPLGGVIWNIRNWDLPGYFWISDYGDFGGFNTGMTDRTPWNVTLNAGVQTFKNTSFAAADGSAPPGDFGGKFNDRCWQDPESGGPTCIDIVEGCDPTWGECGFKQWFYCNKVTVEVNPVKASITGSTNILVGSAGTWEERYEGALTQSGSINITRKDKGVFNCPSGLTTDSTGRRWCTLPVGTSTPFSRSWTPQTVTDVGDYYAVANAFQNATGAYTGDRATECSGNPDCSFNGGWKDCSGAWSNCGPPPLPNDSMEFTVTYSPPNCAIAGSKLNATVGETLLFATSANSPTANLNALEIYRCPVAADCTRGSNWTRMQQFIEADLSDAECSPWACAEWFFWNTAGMAAGDYYLASNIYDRDPRDPWPPPSGDFYTGYVATEATGDPTCSFNGGSRNCSSAWSNCGPNDYLTVTLSSALPPTCTSVSCSPNSMALFVEQATGRTLTPTVNGLSNGTVNNVSYFSSNTGVATVNSPSSSSPYQTTVNPNTRGLTTITATANLSGAGGTGSCQGTCSNVSVGGCSVFLSASSVTNPNPVTASFTGRSPNSGTEPVRLFLKSQDGLIDEFLTSCDSVNGSTCSGFTTLRDLPAKDYWVHCDIPNDPDKCTGNPFGVPAGWESCSTNDNAALTVADPAPTCTGVTVAPAPMALFPEQLTGRTLTPTVSGISYGSISSVEYSSDDPSVAAVNPLSSVFSPFQTTVNPLVRGSTYINASARLSGAGGTGSCWGRGLVSVGGCSVSLSAPSMLSNGSVTATYTGRSPNSGVTEPVRLWLKSADRLIDQMLGSCDSVNGSPCSPPPVLISG